MAKVTRIEISDTHEGYEPVTVRVYEQENEEQLQQHPWLIDRTTISVSMRGWSIHAYPKAAELRALAAACLAAADGIESRGAPVPAAA